MKRDRYELAAGQSEHLDGSLEVKYALIIEKGAYLTVDGDVNADSFYCAGTLRARGVVTIRGDAICLGALSADKLDAKNAVLGAEVSAPVNAERSVAAFVGVDADFVFEYKHLPLSQRYCRELRTQGFEQDIIVRAIRKMKTIFLKNPRTPEETVADAVQKKTLLSKPFTSASFSSRGWMWVPENLLTQRELKRLKLDSNGLREVPDEIGQLSSLKTLELAHNELRTLPEGIGGCKALETLDLSFNFLQTLPNAMADLGNLYTLNMGYARSEGSTQRPDEMPEALFSLSAVRSLNLESNGFKRVSPQIAKLTTLKTLNLNHCKFTEPLPDVFAELWLEDFGYEGPFFDEGGKFFPSEGSALFELSTLRSLSLGSWWMKGVPSAIGKLRRLEYLNLRRNHLTSLPDALLDLPKLRQLNLLDNEFTTFPELLFEMPQLKHIIIDPKIFEASASKIKKRLPDCHFRFF